MRDRIRQWFQFKRYNWKNYDIALVVVVFILTLISGYILSILGETSFIRQFISIVLGMGIVAFFSIIDYQQLFVNNSPDLYLIIHLNLK